VAADGWSTKDLRALTSLPGLPRRRVGAPRWWFLDEVTAVQGDWAGQVKWLRDNDADFGKDTVVLTGSSANQLTEAAGVLAGRRGRGQGSTDRTLLPIGFRGFARLLNPDLPDELQLDLTSLRSRQARDAYDRLAPWLSDLVRLWDQYLQYGGFPVAVTAARDGEPVPASFLDDMFNVIYRDAFGSSQLSAGTTASLVERLMISMASPLNVNSAAEDVGINGERMRRHLEYLRDAYLIWFCPQKAPKSWTPREKSQDKVYAVDPVIARLAHLRNPARTDIDPTVLTEMLLGMTVHRHAYQAGTPWADESFLFHARTPARKEIDFVSDRLGGVALEGKYTDGAKWRGEAATVNASEWDGILATRSVLDTESNLAWAVPAAFLGYLLDT
jgi:predicted AAA+ superfamily ATPase